MQDPYEARDYLANFDTRRTPHLFFDCLVIGSGVGGMRAALATADNGADTLMVTKADVFESNTAYAQGGIAAVLKGSHPEHPRDKDSIDLHQADTIKVGCGLNDFDAVTKICQDGPAQVAQLVEWGAQFDLRKGLEGEYELGREGGHSASRILHAKGDATGREIARTLWERVRNHEHIRTFTDCFVIDLLTDDGRCVGALTYHERYGYQIFWAKSTVLASGGAGRVYRETTNPEVATADGLALGYRAGAVLMDMEMMQFHPTTLYIAGASRALISEAVRGEGAYLVDRNGDRFMTQVHEDAELAPRDVVSRAIVRQMALTSSGHVYLDTRHIPAEQFKARFPGITQICESFGIDVATDMIPVRPSAHYMIGGVKTDSTGRTNIEALYCVGEASCTGVHGANRLASNSLLEALVFGAAAGESALANCQANGGAQRPSKISHHSETRVKTDLDLQDVRRSLQSLMWRNVGIERSSQPLEEALDVIHFWGRYVMDKTFDQVSSWETQNMLTVAQLMARSALERTESRGVHYRTDYADRDDEHWRTHVQLRRSQVRRS